jgi:hypothetical protein
MRLVRKEKKEACPTSKESSVGPDRPQRRAAHHAMTVRKCACGSADYFRSGSFLQQAITAEGQPSAPCRARANEFDNPAGCSAGQAAMGQLRDNHVLRPARANLTTRNRT